MILVTGGSGRVGGCLVSALVDEGVAVRAVRSRPRPLDRAGRVEWVCGDLRELDVWRAALVGVERVFLYALSGLPDQLAEVMREAGVRHGVALSSAAVLHAAADNPIAQRHRRVEEVASAGCAVATILRSDTFAANTLAWAPEIRERGVVRTAYPDAMRNPIHEADIAAVAAKALTQAQPSEECLSLTGPEIVTVREQVSAIGIAIGRQVEVQELTEREALDELSESMPAANAQRLLDYAAASKTNVPRLTNTVSEVTGRPASTFAQWASDHADEFR